MANNIQRPATSALSLGDIVYVLFKHKWKIIFVSLLTLGAAIVYRIRVSPPYVSEAKLMVKWVKNVEPIELIETTDTVAADRGGDAVIKSELEVITSWDLATAVADEVGAEKLVGADSRRENAATVISKGLTVSAERGSNVIRVSFSHADPRTAQEVLEGLVRQYFIQHKAHRRSVQSLADILSKHKASSSELGRLEEEMKAKKLGSSMPVAELMVSVDAEAAKAKSDLDAATVGYAEQQAWLAEVEKYVSLAGGSRQSAATPPGSATGQDSTIESTPEHGPAGATPPDNAVIAEYQTITGRLPVLKTNLNAALTKFASEHTDVKNYEAQIRTLENRRADLETKYPQLVATAATPGSSVPRMGPDMVSERAKLASLEARIKHLTPHVASLSKRALDLAGNAPEIARLERERETEQKNFDHLSASLVKAEANTMVPSSQMPGIAVVQKPTPGVRDTKRRNQILLGIVGAGPALSVALVLLFGLFFNRSIKRPLELEEGMGLPLMLSIPWFSRRKRLRASQPMGVSKPTKLLKESASGKAPWEQYHFIRPFAEAIRDRLSASFESRGDVHKPKLIAVTGYSEGAGASTLAAGLASSLSETGEGKVLLVDMNGSQGEVHPFFDGRPALSLTKALRRAANGVLPAPEECSRNGNGNLMIARADTPASGAASMGLRRMMPHLKASDFDYVIFDMPPLGQTKPTATMAGFMDKVLVVVEAEVTSRSEVQRGHRDLTDAGADVAMIFNKARFHGPRALVGGI